MPEPSAQAQRSLVNGNVQFAVIDSALYPEHLKEMPNLWMVPSLAQGVAIVFNVPIDGVLLEELNITREQLANIFLGRTLQWAGLAASNPILASVRHNITLVVRRENCFLSRILTSALSSFSPEWKGKVGTNSDPLWPRKDALRRSGDSEVASTILEIPYSIGYVSDTYIKDTKVSPHVARISNKAGEFVTATDGSLAAAMTCFSWGTGTSRQARHGSVFYRDIVDPPEEADHDGISCTDAYPIVGNAYFVFNIDTLTCSMLHDVLYLIVWSWENELASEIARRQAATPIPRSVYLPLMERMASIQCGGDSVMLTVIKQLLPEPCKQGERARSVALRMCLDDRFWT